MFIYSSVGKESACNAGDPSSIPRSGRSFGEGIGYALQHSWASLVAQLVKILPAMWETWVRSLCWEDPLEKGKGTQSSILAWKISGTIQSMGLQRVRHDWAIFTSLPFTCLHMCVFVLSLFSHVWLFASIWTIVFQVSLSMGFSRQEYWSGLLCPPPGESFRPRDGTNISCGRWVLLPLMPPVCTTATAKVTEKMDWVTVTLITGRGWGQLPKLHPCTVSQDLRMGPYLGKGSLQMGEFWGGEVVLHYLG